MLGTPFQGHAFRSALLGLSSTSKRNTEPPMWGDTRTQLQFSLLNSFADLLLPLSFSLPQGSHLTLCHRELERHRYGF